MLISNVCFFSGDSAGANIAHNMAIRVGVEKPHGFKLVGITLIHAYFTGKEPIGSECEDVVGKATFDKLWLFVSPTSSGSDDPFINPVMNPSFPKLGCDEVLVCVAEKDSIIRDRGWYYKEELEKSGWGGVVEIMEDEGEGHLFHLYKPTCEKAVAMLKRLAAFMN